MKRQMEKNNNTNPNWGIMIFRDTFEYLKDGDLTKDEFCTLMMCIYNLRENGELPNEEELPKAVKLVWKTLKHSVSKSVTNAKYYKTKKEQKPKKGDRIFKNTKSDTDYFCPWTDNTEDIYAVQHT